MLLIKKPWGQEELLEINNRYVVKRLTMNEGCSCSLQYHEQKLETIIVLFGTLIIQKESTKSNFTIGQTITIPPNTIHRMSAPIGTKAIYLECSTPELDDVVRLEDIYGRIKCP